jgi:anti-sigma factor RsiW
MNCTETRELLSAYYDGELPPEVVADVDAHVNECATCAQEIASFRQLSAMAGEMTTPQPPDSIWAGLEAQLSDDTPQPAAAGGRFSKRWRVAATLAALAATGLVGAFVGYQLWGPRHHGQQMAANLNQYVDVFQRSPVEAQQLLLTAYPSTSVDLSEAADKLGYRPALAAALPAGYSIDAVHVLEMPCCTCAQILCKRDNGSVVAIFEHDANQKMWFGDRPKVATTCECKPCNLIDVNGQLVATWQKGERHLTFVGLEDVEELETLAAALEKG